MNDPTHAALPAPDSPAATSTADDEQKPHQPHQPPRKRRRRRSPAQWRELVEQQPASGLGVEAFCKLHDAGIAGFCAWRSRLRTDKPEIATAAAADPAPAFLRVHAEPEHIGSTLTATFPGGVTLSLSVDHLPALVAALRETTPC